MKPKWLSVASNPKLAGIAKEMRMCVCVRGGGGRLGGRRSTEQLEETRWVWCNSCYTWYKKFHGQCGNWTRAIHPPPPSPPSPRPHHHHHSHIHVPHLSNSIWRWVHSAVAFYMNNKPDYAHLENSLIRRMWKHKSRFSKFSLVQLE